MEMIVGAVLLVVGYVLGSVLTYIGFQSDKSGKQ